MEQKLKQIFSDILKLSIDEIDDETSMKTVKKWDSLKHMKLITAIEEEMGVPRLGMNEIVKMTDFKIVKEILSEKGVVF
ncbi:MAG TPA: acyl carrier protein [bacterium]|nr:acyl carrier protein [bacterium]